MLVAMNIEAYKQNQYYIPLQRLKEESQVNFSSTVNVKLHLSTTKSITIACHSVMKTEMPESSYFSPGPRTSFS